VPRGKAIWNANGGFVSVLLTHLYNFFLPTVEYFFIFDYLTVILPRQLLSTATALYSSHPLDVDFSREPHSTPYVDFGRHQHQKS